MRNSKYSCDAYSPLLLNFQITTLCIIVFLCREPLRDAQGFCIPCQPGQPGELVGRIERGHPVRKAVMKFSAQS
jgi:hypothetical protein